MNTTEHTDGWDDFAELLALIRNLFGDVLKASEALAPKVAESASRWLRGAEAFARVLVLALARSVMLAPMRTAGALAGPAAQAGPPHAGEAPAVRRQRGGGRSLFAFSRSARRRRAYVREEWTTEQIHNWYFFGGKQRAAERKAQRLAEGLSFVAPASGPQRREPWEASAAAGKMPALRDAASPPTQANLVRRFNALVRVFEAPEKAAQRLARRLAAAPALSERILARAAPRERWRTGFDETIKNHARAMETRHDTS